MVPELAEERARLVELEMQILEVERTLAALRLQESVARARLNAYKYPVLSLPDEIIAEMFLHFVPEYPKCSPAAGPCSPMRLTHICRLWREIALATPRLWRALSLPFRSPSSVGNLWLSRAGSLPLAICLQESDGNTPDFPAHVTALLPYLPLCEYLEIGLALRVSDLPIMESEFPILKHLDLSLSGIPPHDIELFSVPMLRSVVVEIHATHGIALPWTQLDTLSLYDITLPNCEDVLRQVTNLVHLTLDLYVDDDAQDFVIQPAITLPHLKSFKADGERNMKRLLDSFVLPSLLQLDVAEDYLGKDPIASLTTFILRSGCKLEKLYVTYADSLSNTPYLPTFASVEEVHVLAGSWPDRSNLHLLS
ncbi:F-box domain-containing protein [Favolaschia claudopus]|uniref:F-box domain-containing protein n=1 Tax=Favolaschia claudopus TaxID=2862362 RepID=A0AAW0AZ96_9AGAR